MKVIRWSLTPDMAVKRHKNEVVVLTDLQNREKNSEKHNILQSSRLHATPSVTGKSTPNANKDV